MKLSLPKIKLNKTFSWVLAIMIFGVACGVFGAHIEAAYYPPHLQGNQQCIKATNASQDALESLSDAIEGKSAKGIDLAGLQNSIKECKGSADRYQVKIGAKK